MLSRPRSRAKPPGFVGVTPGDGAQHGQHPQAACQGLLARLQGTFPPLPTIPPAASRTVASIAGPIEPRDRPLRRPALPLRTKHTGTRSARPRGGARRGAARRLTAWCAQPACAAAEEFAEKFPEVAPEASGATSGNAVPQVCPRPSAPEGGKDAWGQGRVLVPGLLTAFAKGETGSRWIRPPCGVSQLAGPAAGGTAGDRGSRARGGLGRGGRRGGGQGVRATRRRSSCEQRRRLLHGPAAKSSRCAVRRAAHSHL